MIRISSLIPCTAIALAAAGCQSKRDEPRPDQPPAVEKTTPRDDMPSPTPEPPPARANPPAATDELSDAQIAAIASSAHQAEIAAGELAVSKTKNHAVKDFAQMMIDEHTKADEQGKSLVAKLGLTPDESEPLTMMKQESAATATRLASLIGDEFDRAYIAAQVQDHEKVLDMLDTKLIPSADNTELKQLLTSVRPVVATHLEHARTLAAKIR